VGLFQNYVSYQGIHDALYVFMSMIRNDKHKLFERYRPLIKTNVTVSAEFYRVIEFKNVSKLYWVMHHTELVVYVTVKSLNLINAKGCFITVLISPHIMELYPHLDDVFRIPTFRVKEISPPLIFLKEANITKPPFIVMVHKNVSSWNVAQAYCRQHGMELLSLDSLAQWISLMERTHRVFQQFHYFFWVSQIIFIRHKETNQFVTNVCMFSLFKFKT